MIRNAWMRWGTMCSAIGMVAALSGCATDPAVDPTGNWVLSLSWGAGNCGLSGSVPSTTTITQGPNGYVLAESNPNITAVGIVQCDADRCTLSATETGRGTYSDGTGYTGSVSLNLTLDANKRVTGSGQYGETGDDSSSCSQTFTATGSKS